MTRAERVLVTGGTGFIGSHVVRSLLASGRDVAVLTRSGTTPERIRDIYGAFTVLQGDVSHAPELRGRFAAWGPHACIHLAWYAEPGKYLHSRDNISALAATVDLMTTLGEIGCNRFAMAGTCAEYDTRRGWLKEGGPTRPETLYAATKLAAGEITQQVARTDGLQVAWGRIFYPYGPGEDERRAVPAAIRSLLFGSPFKATLGEQIRDYIHVEDVASAFVTLLDNSATGLYNVCSGVPVTMRHLMEAIGDLTGRTDLLEFGAIPYRDWEPMFICGDNSRLKTLGWSPRYRLLDGLRQTIDWWRRRS